MSDMEVVVGELTLFDEHQGEHKLSTGQSFTLTKVQPLYCWLKEQYPNRDHPNYLEEYAISEGNKVKFLLQYWAFDDELGCYIGCDSSIEKHLKRFDII